MRTISFLSFIFEICATILIIIINLSYTNGEKDVSESDNDDNLKARRYFENMNNDNLLINPHVPIVSQIIIKILEKGIKSKLRCLKGSKIDLSDYMYTPVYIWGPHSHFWQYENNVNNCLYFQVTLMIANKNNGIPLKKKFQNVRILGLIAKNGKVNSCDTSSAQNERKKLRVKRISEWSHQVTNVNNYKTIKCGSRPCGKSASYDDTWSSWTNLYQEDTCIEANECGPSQYQWRMCAPSSYQDPNKELNHRTTHDLSCLVHRCIPKCWFCEQPSVRRRPCECRSEACLQLCNYMMFHEKDICKQDRNDPASLYIQKRCTRECNGAQCGFINAPNSACATKDRHTCGLCSKCTKNCYNNMYSKGLCHRKDIPNIFFTYRKCYVNYPCNYKCSQVNHKCDQIEGKEFVDDYVLGK